MATNAQAGGARPASTQPIPDAATTSTTKRGKANRKTADPINTGKAIEDTIAALERNKAGEHEQEAEIERDVKRATRDMNKDISRIQDPVAKMDAIQKRYTDLYADMKRMEREHQKAKKRADQLQKEKDSNRSELGKANAVKDKLEKLCRELQKDNKKLKEENKKLCDNEIRAREQLHSSLEGMVDDVSDLISTQEHPENLPANMEQDEIFRHKFKSFIEQYELRELQFHSLLRVKQLEADYHNARADEQRRIREQEANKSRQLTSQVSTFSQTESELRSQLNIYVEKFKQVEDTLNNSNDLFLTFRREMEEMSKKTKRLEKENQNLTRRHETTNHNILQMAEERTKVNKELEVLRRKNVNLEKLCRGMQAQGRGGVPPNVASQSTVAGAGSVEYDDPEDVTESEYEYGDEGSEEFEHEVVEGTEINGVHPRGSKPVPMPVAVDVPAPGSTPPPPPPSQQAKVNGQKAVVNGVKH